MVFNAILSIPQLYYIAQVVVNTSTIRSPPWLPHHWNRSPHVNMSLHSDTLSWFQVNKSLPLLLNAAENQQIPNYPRSTALEASTLFISMLW